MSTPEHVTPVRIRIGEVIIDGDLSLPAGIQSIVLFAHGSGSGRHSPRNRQVATTLHGSGLGTLLIDLLTPEEEELDLRTAELRFDIDLLGSRVIGATDWLSKTKETADLVVGYYGASTGAAAALIAAAERPDKVGAVVSRGGRPDLANAALVRVRAPTLLIVGGADEQVLELNRRSLARLESESRLEIVAGASHLFEEPGALEEVARLARDWFALHFQESRRRRERESARQ